MIGSGPLSTEDLAVDHQLADIALSFRFLLDLTPVNGSSAQARFESDGLAPRFQYRPLEQDPAVVGARLDAVPIDSVEDGTLAHLLRAREREIRLQVEMLSCRGSQDFLPLSIELYGAVSPALLAEARALLDRVPVPPFDGGPWLDADAFARAARAELDRYRAEHQDINAHVEIREGSSGLMVSHGELLVAPTLRVPEARAEARQGQAVHRRSSGMGRLGQGVRPRGPGSTAGRRARGLRTALGGRGLRMSLPTPPHKGSLRPAEAPAPETETRDHEGASCTGGGSGGVEAVVSLDQAPMRAVPSSER